MRFDTVITGGSVVDGTGSAPRRADVAIAGGLIAAIEPDLAGTDAYREAGERIDATGRLVTPGFVDVHTHFDGQATWDGVLEPSSGHGVTTVVTGNCGVGFAPVREDDHDALIELMEGVEDIPGAALSEGISWGWETFPEYLDVLQAGRWAVDVGTQLAHGPLRRYVLGPRALDPAAGDDDLTLMARLVREAVEAGALGFTTSRTLGHRALDGTPVPGTHATLDELTQIAEAVAAGGGRVFEIAGSGLARSDKPAAVAEEFEWVGRLAGDTGLRTTFLLMQSHGDPDRWRQELHRAAAWRAAGAPVTPLIAGRPFGILYGWDVRHPFMARPAYRALAGLAAADRLEQLRDPAVRAAILTQEDEPADPVQAGQLVFMRRIIKDCHVISGLPDYEQPRERTLGALAVERGVSVEEVAYDGLVEGHAMLLYALYNYAGWDHAVLLEQLEDPDAVLGLADGGAHSAYICDASVPTSMLTHWVRDRTRGPRIELTEAVRRLTSHPADLYGLADRGRVAVGLRADLNVIDHDRLALAMPRAVPDLPAGGTRLLQAATGYDVTMVAGEVTRRGGVDTGARPGRLIRG